MPWGPRDGLAPVPPTFGAPQRSRGAPLHPLYALLQRAQEGDEVVLLLRGQAEVEALVVEVDGVGQRGGRAVVEVRRAADQPAKDRSLEASHVLPLAGDERPARVRDDLDLVRALLAQRVH